MKTLGPLLVLLLVSVALFAGSARADSHSAPPVINVCYVTNLSGPVAFISCEDVAGNIIPGGQVDLPEVINEVLVPGPTVTLPPETITLPPIRETITLPPLPAPTRTVTVPGAPRPTQTVTIPGPTQIIPGPTETVTTPSQERTVTNFTTFVLPGKTATVTETPPVETETVFVRPTRQPRPDHATIAPGEIFIDPPALTIPQAAGIGAATLVFLLGLVVLALWGGYIVGYKDSDRENRQFLAALRDQFYYRGNHS